MKYNCLRPLGRGLSHNLAGELLQQVLSGSVTAERLVAMEPEDLAPAAVKEARREEQERYFRAEVRLRAIKEGLSPASLGPKRMAGDPCGIRDRTIRHGAASDPFLAP